MIACNSTVLIFLSKLDKLSLLKELFKQVLIPEEVKREVVDEGKRKNHIDAIETEKAINEGWIKVENTEIHPLLMDIGIDKGEAEAISLAYKKKLGVLLDQTHAREAAKLLVVGPKGTLYVLLLALKKRLISYDDYMLSLFDLIQFGFRMSEGVYLEAVRLGKELAKK
ncbi:MAG: DUF3368 domain-containing protein [Candidatus Woesearchaeota archaeon]|jgi:hypothetical protein|nr:DUF3368 domain-containing protein [Candidatus Woesearchaeota archaeon]MDP7506160.1 DUF3368 domain-containing protein [Candidatus Woesearchaeota archaeon]MDP7610750.1 DUF3368 domain-containing protein [Candidatus Woesearchaeota archaeon]|tara:strand:- start:928 stop:1431 length:504 start_codon:yes stop_codon:yes gene_type:complete